MVILALVFILLVAIAAACNVVSGLVGLGIVPAFPGSEWFFIVKNYIGNLVLWTILAIVIMAAVRIGKERRKSGAGTSLAARGRPRSPLLNPRIAVALTAYNDELSVGDAVRDFKSQPLVEAVFVVDNNCHDATAAVAREAGATVVTERRQGYGWACQRGLRAAMETGAEVIVLSEGDGTFGGRSIAQMIPFLDDADMVLGNRVTPGLVDRSSQMDSFFIWGNQLGAKLLQLRFWESRFLGRVQLSDLGCTYRAIRREALVEIIDELSVGGMHFSPHMIMMSLRQGHDVLEVPIRFSPRVGLSKGASSLVAAVRIGAAMLWHIMTFPVQPLSRADSGPRVLPPEVDPVRD
ncbi:MAG TPA: glycosyltransferase family 2 protein [Dehalococcoidia bacterium]|nr:glycosyltransferase family 2 protein [Dehalococcoidia bacterium]